MSPQGAQKTPFRAGSDYFDLVKPNKLFSAPVLRAELKRMCAGTAPQGPYPFERINTFFFTDTRKRSDGGKP